MSWLDKLEKRFRPFAVPNVTMYLIAGQTIVYVLALNNQGLSGNVALIPTRVFQGGEVWRLVTFLFYPPITNALFAFITWYLFYLMGDALETQWGVARYNIFLLIAYLATIAAAFLGYALLPSGPEVASTNFYIGTVVYLAFAYLFPDFQLMLFFILPVKVKWLAVITWIYFAFQLVMGPTWTDRLLVIAAVGTFLLFFGRDIVLTMRSKRQRVERQVQQIKMENEPVHRCVICGVTDKSEPGMDFRYCSRCVDSPCYCGDHIRGHEHRT